MQKVRILYGSQMNARNRKDTVLLIVEPALRRDFLNAVENSTTKLRFQTMVL